MKTLLATITFWLLFITPSLSQDVTNESVRLFLASVDQAISDLDKQRLGDNLSEDAIIILNIDNQGDNEVMRPSKQQYLSLLELGWSFYDDYEYSQADLEITIDGTKAFVSSTVIESMYLQGHRISGESEQEVTIEWIENKPLITKVVGFVKI